MGTLYRRELAAGWTMADFRAAQLSVLAEAWGPYTFYNGSSVDNQYCEFPDYGGGKVTVQFDNATAGGSLRIATGFTTEMTGSRQFRRYQNHGSLWGLYNSNAVNTNVMRMVAASGEDYQLFSMRCGSASSVAHASRLRNVPPFWGASPRLVAGGSGTTFHGLNGANPWGTINPETGNSAVTGVVQHTSYHSPLPAIANTLTTRRQVSRNLLVGNSQATVGFIPEDFVFAANSGVASDRYFKLVDEEGGVYLMFGGVGTAGFACHVTSGELWPDLETIQCFAVDLANPASLPPLTDCPPPERPLSGQLHPLFVPVPPPPNPNPETP